MFTLVVFLSLRERIKPVLREVEGVRVGLACPLQF